jgi:hypothetical protein
MSDNYAKQLKIENANLEIELQTKQSEFNKYDRVNTYYSQDEVMIIYIQKIMTILYAVIYLVFVYFLYSNQDKYNIFISILFLIIFAALPFVFQLISKFFFQTFLKILHAFSSGNAKYLYR